MDFTNSTVKFSEIKQNERLADLYSTLYLLPQEERIKILMSWLQNAFSDLLIPFLPEEDVLDSFTVHIKLLNTFAMNSAYDIVVQLSAEFSHSFLHAQVLPNLLENLDRAADITFYFRIVCENLTCPALVRKIVELVTTKLTPVLITRLTSDDHKVACSTISLLKTLLEFYCEDLWYDLILQYLLPMKHHLTSQRQKVLPEIEFHHSTNKLLDLIPKCVTNAISTEQMEEDFYAYYSDAIRRLRLIDSCVVSSLPSSKSDLEKVGLNVEQMTSQNIGEKKTRNPTYPMWIFKYDGSDFLHAFRQGYFEEQEPEEFFEDDLFSASNALSSTLQDEIDDDDYIEHTSTPINDSDYDNSFTDSLECNIQRGSVVESIFNKEANNTDDISSENINRDSIPKNKRNSADNLIDSNNRAYFGPLLSALYVILGKWTTIDPDILFTATELISLLASSRIPLVNSIFLDMSLILQPSYRSFSSIIHSTRNDLDDYMRKYPDQLIRNTWQSGGKDCATDINSNDASYGTSRSFVDSLRQTISSNISFKIASEEVKKTKVGRSSSFRTFTEMFKSKQGSASPRPSEFRLLHRSSAPFSSEEDERCAKVMALRCVLFSHWMIELSAIAMQLCWGIRSFHETLEVGEINDENTTKSLLPEGCPSSSIHLS